MVTDLGHLSLNSIDKLSDSQHHEDNNDNNHGQVSEAQVLHHNNPSSGGGGGSWMWNPSSRHHRHHQEAPQDEESWEVRAFAEDTGSVMGTTWPPRSYTCTFCRREFRSAQALGGHMNVHRRDRARLHQGSSSSSSSPGALIIPAQELMAAAGAGPGGGGLCFLYQLPPNHNAAMYSSAAPTNNIDAWAAPPGLSHQYHRKSYNKSGESPNSSSIDYSNCKNNGSSSTSGANNMEELDLELRL